MNELTVIDSVYFVWACIFGLLFIIKSYYMLTLSFEESYWVPVPLWVRIVSFLIGAVGVLCGLSLILLGMYAVLT
jgi:hypothetical protein